jgi:hypothetical protein
MRDVRSTRAEAAGRFWFRARARPPSRVFRNGVGDVDRETVPLPARALVGQPHGAVDDLQRAGRVPAVHGDQGLGGHGEHEPGAGGQGQGDGQAEGTGEKTFNRSKLVCDCYPERSIRVSPRQAERGPILCGICGGDFHQQTGDQR